MNAAVQSTVDAFGGIDILVNNASAIYLADVQHTDIRRFDLMHAVNTRGSFECAKAVVPLMRKQKYGKIVNVASGTQFKGSPGMMHYVASKGAVVAMTRVMARELGADNICVNAIAPGVTDSEMMGEHAKRMQPTIDSRCFKRVEKPEDLVGTVVFLCSDASAFITGQTFNVDGGTYLH